MKENSGKNWMISIIDLRFWFIHSAKASGCANAIASNCCYRLETAEVMQEKKLIICQSNTRIFLSPKQRSCPLLAVLLSAVPGWLSPDLKATRLSGLSMKARGFPGRAGKQQRFVALWPFATSCVVSVECVHNTGWAECYRIGNWGSPALSGVL